MRVRFWGTRGSIAKPGRTTLRYGGNTSCVEVEASDGTLVVLDCGTGAHDLAVALRERGALPPVGHLLIGHTHWDHIQGFPFFEPLLDTRSAWQVYAPGGRLDHLEDTLAGQMSYDYHPIALGDLKAVVRFHVLTEGTFPVGGIRVAAQYLHHPALTLGYRLEADGAKVVYATDHEPHAVPHVEPAPGAQPVHPEDARHVTFLSGADLVIHDAQYLFSEYPVKRGWGHTPVECAVDYAIVAGARRLALFHHDPERHDEAVDRLVDLARERAAAEGQELELEGPRERMRALAGTAGSALLAPRPRLARTVLLAEDDPEQARRLREALREDGLRLVEVDDLEAALEAARREVPSLVLIDLDVSRAELLAACRRLRAEPDPRLREVPVLVVDGSSPTEKEVVEAFEAGATDYLSKPIKVTLLRSRVRGWLLRARAE